jgi:nonribosomal peptide synthetase DhbF
MDNHSRPDARDNAARMLPRTQTERILLEIWSAILNIEGICVDDHFLEIGGDSLAAMRCINRIKATFGTDVPLQMLFSDPGSISGVAAHLDRMRSETQLHDSCQT